MLTLFETLTDMDTGTKLEQLISVSQAARLAGVSEATIRLRIRSGQLTRHRFGPRLLKVSEAELRALITCGEVTR